ncbi:MAG: hypothetical protein AABY01_03610 [Nanoarchaeota archaeon]
MTDDHLVNIVLSQAYERIKSSAGFICIITKDDPNNPSLIAQIEYAKKLDKPFYLILQRGTELPEAVKTANVRIQVYCGPSDKDQFRAIKKATDLLQKDFPDVPNKTTTIPDISDLT